MPLDMSVVLFSAATVAALIYLLASCHQPASWPKTWIKTASVLLLAMIAFSIGGIGPLSAALLLCAMGDFFLSREGEPAFLAGVGSFAAGHLAFAWLFVSMPDAHPESLLDTARLFVALGLGLYGVVMMRLLFARAGDLRWAVLAYVPVIVAMALAAFALPITGWLILVQLAAVAFVLSDSVLAAELFLLAPDSRWRRVTPVVIWAFYWLAQAGFLLGVMFHILA